MTTILVSLIVLGSIAAVLAGLQESIVGAAAESYEAIAIPVKNTTVRDIARSAAYDRRLY